MNNAMALPVMEAPKQAAVEPAQMSRKMVRDKYAGEDTQSHAPRDDFKKKLAECAEGNDCARQPVAPEETRSGSTTTDISMCQHAGIKEMLENIVGILEGFELLDYQETQSAQTKPEWLAALLGEAKPQIAQTVQEFSLAVGRPSEPAAASQMEQQSALLDQFARMLQDSQLGKLPRKAQQEIIQTVGEVFGSFESTNNESRTAQAKLPADSVFNMEDLGLAMLKAKTVAAKQDAGTQTDRQTPDAKPEAAAAKPEAAEGRLQAGVGAVSDTVPRFFKAEAVQGTMKEAPEPSTFFKENAVRIVDKMKAQVGEGKSEFEIQLKPNFLGKLNIKLTMENGEMKMLIKTQEAVVRSLIAEQLPAMQEMLREKGFAVTSADVVYEQPGMQSDDSYAFARQNHSGNGKKHGWRKRFAAEPAAESMFYGAVNDAPAGYLVGSSMEFRA